MLCISCQSKLEERQTTPTGYNRRGSKDSQLRKEADAYDKMIDAAADLADLIEMSKIGIASHLPMINL